MSLKGRNYGLDKAASLAFRVVSLLFTAHSSILTLFGIFLLLLVVTWTHIVCSLQDKNSCSAYFCQSRAHQTFVCQLPLV